MSVNKTPGVYITEKNAFPNSIIEVASAVPAFIGYTEKAMDGNGSLLNKPRRIDSMAEFRACFGGAPKPRFNIVDDPGDKSGIKFRDKNYLVRRKDNHSLYCQMMLFYYNGGGPCYVVSVGGYSDPIDKVRLENGIAPLLGVQEPTMLVIPEAVCLPVAGDCYALQRTMLKHCGHDMQNRFAILDIYDGYKESKNCIDAFHDGIGRESLDYGAAYYPWVNSSVVSEIDLDFGNIDAEQLKEILTYEIEVSDLPEDKKALALEYIHKIGTGKDEQMLHKILTQLSPLYSTFLREMCRIVNLLPVSAVMAGVYTKVDSTRGVWKAPANVGIVSANTPAVDISDDEQGYLNVPRNGKAVNAIRFFRGEGVKVWGARTLDGNSLDWRYINVRRTMIMLEGSIGNAARAYSSEPNTASTWIALRSMIENFLRGIWKRGGLAGASPEDAFEVHVGLGDTMTAEDILEGIMRVRVLVAVSRPAEFIEISFRQQMQKS